MNNIQYNLAFPNRLNHKIAITLTISNVQEDALDLILPDWRPGRYELTNYAANLTGLKAYGVSDEKLSVVKVKKNEWSVQTNRSTAIRVEYEFYAHYLDAGGSLVDDTTIYINFVNCLLYSSQRMNEQIELSIDIPEQYDVVCDLKRQQGGTLIAPDYLTLVDSPILASTDIRKLTYTIEGCLFEIAIKGEVPLEDDKIIDAFNSFSLSQVGMMGSFPNESFLFILYSLPYRFYHGVEHKNCTVITLGPWVSENADKYFDDLIGVASHELFHAWNVTRIRPKELMPYDLSRENYYQTGFVTEGFTTYYGDLFLSRSGIYGESQYFAELNRLFERHFENYARFVVSIRESSMDLWVDGYSAARPKNKVSIYVKGALVALMLDLTILRKTDGRLSLDDVMLKLWQSPKVLEEGYTEEDVYTLIRDILGDEMGSNFIKRYIDGCVPLEEPLSELLEWVGCSLVIQENQSDFTARLGVKVKENVVVEIAPDAPAYQALSVGDAVQALNGNDDENSWRNELFGLLESNVSLSIERRGTHFQAEIPITCKRYYNRYSIGVDDKVSEDFLARKKLWLGER